MTNSSAGSPRAISLFRGGLGVLTSRHAPRLTFGKSLRELTTQTNGIEFFTFLAQ